MKKIETRPFNWGALLSLPVIAVFLWEILDEGPDQNPWRLLPPFVAIIALAITASVLAARRRLATLRRESAVLGLTFNESADERFKRTFFEAEGLRRLTLFQSVDHPVARNVMTGTLVGADAAVFDYSYRTRQANPGSSVTASQTVAAFRLPGRALPHFELSPNGLRGDDERAIRSLNLPESFALTVECFGEYVVVYRLYRHVNPEKLRDFVDQATAVIRALTSATGDLRSGTA